MTPLTNQDAALGRDELAAAALVAARVSGQQFEGLADELRPRDVVEGYRVQRSTYPLLEGSGFGRQGGWKVGCTTSVMQAYLGVDVPTAGAMFLSTMFRGSHRLSLSPPRILGVECEIAVRLGRDLVQRDRDYSSEDVADAVFAVMAAIEVVEDRYLDYHALDTPTLVADSFFHFGCVLGAENESFDPRSLGEVTASMTINGVVVGSGIGTDILGDPIRVLAWLANHCVALETPLLAGDIVMLGSLVQTQWVNPGDVVEVHNTQLGEVSVSFEEASS